MIHKILTATVLLLLQSASSLAEVSDSFRNSYVLRPNDVVELSVYDEPELTKRTRVLKSGEVSFELINTVRIGGLSLSDASKLLHERFAEYIRFPQVTLTVIDYAVDYVNVIGRVETPGKIPLPELGQLDLRSALESAGGVTELADRNKIKLKSSDGEEQTFTYDFIREKGGTVTLGKGDQVIVGESPFAGKVVSVVGEIENPGTVKIPPSGKLALANALAQLGGLTEVADTKRIRLIRSDGSTSSYSLTEIQGAGGNRVNLAGGDRIVVPKSPFAGATVSVFGPVKRPGVIDFPIDGKLTLSKAIAKAGGPDELANTKKVILTRRGDVQRTYNLRDLREKGQVIWLVPNDEIRVSERWL